MGRKRTPLPHRPPAPTQAPPPKLQPGLTPRRARFVGEYLKDFNATQAAIRAGYSRATARQQGARLLADVYVAEAISAAQAELRQRCAIERDEIAQELAKLAFANIHDFIRIAADGDPYFDFSNLDRQRAAAIAEITVEDFKDGRGPDARDVRRIRCKLADKRQSLMDLARLLGYLTDKVEHSGTVSIEAIERRIQEETRRLPQARLDELVDAARQFLEQFGGEERA